MRLYTWRRAGLADKAGSDTMPDAAGGEGGHGSATPNRVLHRYAYITTEILQGSIIVMYEMQLLFTLGMPRLHSSISPTVNNFGRAFLEL